MTTRTPEQSATIREPVGRAPETARYTLSLDARTWPEVGVGGKARGLHSALRAGLNVPDGFCITTDAFEEVVEGLVDAAEDLDDLREAILDAPLPRELLDELHQRMEASPRQSWAVRSSAEDEDAAAQSFAGQLETVLHVDSMEEMTDAIRRVWASLFRDEAILYRMRVAVDAEPGAMAVVVQEMVDPASAGVLFTRNPVSDVASEAVVSATRGLGTTVVGGEACDSYYIERPSGYLRNQDLADDDEGAVLDASLLSEFGRIADRVERLFGGPMDIEWALDKPHDGRFEEASERLQILQIRPITGSSPADVDESVWTNANVGEALPGVGTPLTWSIIRRFSRRGFERAFGSLGLDVPEDYDLVGSFYGRVYLNLTQFANLASSIPILKAETLFSMAGGGGVELVEDVYATQSPVEFVMRLPITIPKIALSQATMPFLAPLWERYFEMRCESFFSRNLARLNHGALEGELDAVDGLFERTGEVLLACSSNFLMTYVATREILHLWGTPDAMRRERDLMAGLEVQSAEPGFGLLHLGRIARRSRRLRRIIQETEPSETLRALREEDRFNDVALFLEELQKFRSRFGHRAPREAELATPRWREDTTFLFEVLRSYIDAPHLPTPAELKRSTAKTRSEIERIIDRGFSPTIRTIFRLALAVTRGNARLRETLRSRVVDSLDMYRHFFLECGRRLVRTGYLRDDEDVFFLRHDEIRAWLEDVSVAERFRYRVLVRRKVYETFRDLPDPPAIFVLRGREIIPEEQVVGRREDVHLPDDYRELRGLPASSGRVTGRARVITDPTEDAHIEPGEVLIVPHADVGWTPLFLTASAVVMGLGGPLSHAAIVAREYGIPAVVNAKHATEVISTGDLVTIDGEQGIVYLREE